jgi:hypothetical protein
MQQMKYTSTHLNSVIFQIPFYLTHNTNIN